MRIAQGPLRLLSEFAPDYSLYLTFFVHLSEAAEFVAKSLPIFLTCLQTAIIKKFRRNNAQFKKSLHKDYLPIL